MCLVVTRTWVTIVKTSLCIHSYSNNSTSFDTVMIILEIQGELLVQSQQRAAAKWYWMLISHRDNACTLFFKSEGGFSDTGSSHSSYLALVTVVPHSASSSPWFIHWDTHSC